MQGVVREGTGQGLKSYLPPEIAIAGKTGTTDEQRDAWFAGFSGDRLAVVWVGYDDNRAARLSGSSRGAADLGRPDVGARRPSRSRSPGRPRVEMVSIDPQSGLRGGASCPGAVELPFMQGSAPTGTRALLRPDGRRGRGGRRGRAGGRRDRQARQNFLERLFGR